MLGFLLGFGPLGVSAYQKRRSFKPALRVLECVDLRLEASGVDQAPQDVVVDVSEPECDATHVLKAPVDGFDRAVGSADVEKCQDVGAALMQAAPELGELR